MRLAWSLREDLRAGRDIDDPEARLDFRLWWLSSASREFPAVECNPQPEDAALAGEILIPATGPRDAAVTRLMDFIRRLRPKEAAGFDVATPEGRRALAAWHYACVVPELSLFSLLDARERAWLLEPVTPPLAPAGLPLPRLVRLTWENRTDVRQTFDLSQPGETWALLAWYWIYGAAEMGHQAYAAWLSAREFFSPRPELGGLPHMALFAWQADDAQRARINPATPAGKAALATWLEETRTLPRLAQALLEAPAGHACPPPPPPPAQAFGTNIIGYARGELGIGEDSRMCALALAQAAVPFAVVNIPVGSNTREQDAFLDACLVEDTPYPVNIFCLTGLDTARMWLERGEALFSGRVNVGYWPWELPAWPEAMADAYALVDELWVSSAYTRDAFAKSAPIPVRLAPMAVSVDRITPRPRDYFGLPGDRFLFLYTFDCNSYLARKNPLAAIRAFRAAFPRGTEPVGLVLKTMNARDDDPRWLALAASAAADARIAFLHGTLDRGDVLGLFAACDAYVSPHRAEGFGRTLAEAMLLGKPVIATGYSGNADFLTPETGYPVPYRFVPIGDGEYPFGQGLVWAEPDADTLAKAMRRVADAPEEAARRARAGRDMVAERHHPLAVGHAYKERLEALCR
jgi:glycosyltransferase involved in cell wall biosynthesis